MADLWMQLRSQPDVVGVDLTISRQSRGRQYPRLIIAAQADGDDRYSQRVEAPQSSERTRLQVLDFVEPQIPVGHHKEREREKSLRKSAPIQAQSSGPL